MTFRLFQAVPSCISHQPSITQIQPLVLWDTNQICKPGPFLSKYFTSQQDPIAHCLWNPYIHHFGNLWMLCLSHSFNCTVTLAICPLPLLAPFGFFIDPSRHKWLFYFEVWVDGVEMSSSFGLIFPIFVVPIEDFYLLRYCCNFFSRKNGSGGCWFNWLLLRFFWCFLNLGTFDLNFNKVFFFKIKWISYVYVCFLLPLLIHHPIPVAF